MDFKIYKFLKLLYLGFLFFAQILHSQINLIPNYSFERYDSCSQFIGNQPFEPEIRVSVQNWIPRDGLPEYFSKCWNNEFWPKTGDANIALDFKISLDFNPIQIAVEQVQIALEEKIVANQLYYIEYWVKIDTFTPAGNTKQTSVYNTGVFFVDSMTFTWDYNKSDEPFHFIDTTTEITDTEWKKISGCFEVDKSYPIMVGFLFANQDFVPTNRHSLHIYSSVEIDDVILTPIDPFLTLTIPHDTICVGDCITLASNHSLIDATFEWDLPGSDYNGQDTGFITVCYNQVGVFDIGLKVEHCAGIFEETWEKRITVIEPPNQIAPDHQVIDIKEGEEIEIGCADAGNVQWIPTDGLKINGINAIATDQVLENTTYSCIVGDSIQCGFICTFEFRLKKYPIADFEVSDLKICEGDCISIHNQSEFTSGEFTYIIQGERDYSETIKNTEKELCLEAGNYTMTLVVWNDIGRDSIEYQNIEVSPFPTEISNSPRDIVADYGDTVLMTSPYNGNLEWTSSSITIPCFDCNQWSFEVEMNSTIDLLAFIDPMCSVETQFKIRVENIPNEIYLPTAITPNGDGINDKWKPYHDPGVTILGFSIYERWGGLVFSSNALLDSWDGTQNGRDVEQGVYVVVVKYRDVSDRVVVVSGDLTVFR